MSCYQPYSYIDLERDAEVQEMLDRFSRSIDDLPVLIHQTPNFATAQTVSVKTFGECTSINDWHLAASDPARPVTRGHSQATESDPPYQPV